MEKQTLHLLFKFSESPDEKSGIKTMEEHLNVIKKKGKVIWGHFSSSMKKKGLWNEKIDIMENQMKCGEEAFVLFCDKKNELFYVGRYLKSWSGSEFDTSNKEIELVPEYYHDKVGLIPNGQMRCYCYVLVDNIKVYPFVHMNDIFSKNKKIIENKGQSSVFYVNIGESFYKKLKKDFSIFKEVIKEVEKENEFEFDKLKKETSFEINDTPHVIPERYNINLQNKLKRNLSIVAKAIIFSNYKCEYNDSHKTFISQKTGENYVEGHHLIPLEFQENFNTSIDVESNIIALCPNCHKLLHYGTDIEKREVLKKLYNMRKKRLKSSGIILTFEQLLKYYK